MDPLKKIYLQAVFVIVTVHLCAQSHDHILGSPLLPFAASRDHMTMTGNVSC